MATYNKFEVFVEDLANKEHDLFGTTDTLNIYLSNATPSASADAVLADLAQIATGNGYAGPQDTQNDGTRTNGTFTLVGTKIVITASGGAIAQFRYVVLYNDTATGDPLIAWWDYGSALDLQDGETFTIKFNNSDTSGTIFTLT